MSNWKTEYKAWRFATQTISELIEIRPGVLAMIGWQGLQSLKHCLMAAWLSREMKGFVSK